MQYLLPICVFFPLVAAIIGYLIGRYNKNVRNYFVSGVSIVTFFMMLFLTISFQSAGIEELTFSISEICGMGIYFVLDGFRALYGTIVAFMWMMSALFSTEYFAHYRNRNRYYLFFLVTLGATLGVFLSADLFTTFIFFEMMSFTSYVWVAQDEKKESLRAAETYLAVAVIGGLVMLMGLFLVYDVCGTMNISELKNAYMTYSLLSSNSSTAIKLRIAGICMLFGFGAKAGAAPLHIWLPKAHPVAPAPASALLSGVLTKAGIFGIIIISLHIFMNDGVWGTLILTIGVITMFLGAFLALFSINLKRTLACSSVSQIGFILVGIGMQGLLQGENYIAGRGTLLHMVNHSMIKLVLFMAAGVVYMNLHELDLNKIRGFGRKKPLLKFIFLMGALGIMGVPLWSGYISKTLLHEGIVEYIHLLHEGVSPVIYGHIAMKVIEWIFLISGGLTVCYMTKLYVALFVEKNEDEVLQNTYDEKKPYMNLVSKTALTVSALFMLIAGAFPHQVMDRIADLGQGFFYVEPSHHEIAYFSFVNLKGAIISIFIGIVLYFLVVRKLLMKDGAYVNQWAEWLDLENKVYRPILLGFLPFVGRFICRILDSLLDAVVVLIRKSIFRDSKIYYEPEEGNYFTHLIGEAADNFVRWMNQGLWSYNPHPDNIEHRLAMRYQERSESHAIITRSLSFGLMLVCLGLLLVLIYVLL